MENVKIASLKKIILDTMSEIGYPVGKIEISFNAITKSCNMEIVKQRRLEDGSMMTVAKKI